LTTCRHEYALVALSLIMLMLAPGDALSMSLSEGDTTHVVPYDEGDFERIPLDAAGISPVSCHQTYRGTVFALEVEVFPTAWRPVHVIELVGLNGVSIEPVELPPGWSAEIQPGTLGASAGVLSLYTDSDPIEPGSALGGFKVLSSRNRAAMRWYVADRSGILMGKVKRLVLTCPSATAPTTWGSVKAGYR